MSDKSQTQPTDPRDAAIEALEDRVRELEIEAEYAWSLVQCYKCQARITALKQIAGPIQPDEQNTALHERMRRIAREALSPTTPATPADAAPHGAA